MPQRNSAETRLEGAGWQTRLIDDTTMWLDPVNGKLWVQSAAMNILRSREGKKWELYT